MLSILIPIYNVNAMRLVEELHNQATAEETPFEIICLDDASSEHYHRHHEKIRTWANCTYEVLETNIGRSRIRNRLGQMAKFDYLLFLDCDARVIKSDFIRNYLASASDNSVLVGGRIYPEKPENALTQLHWKVGRLREHENKSGFQSNNFLIPRVIFQTHQFEETLIGYGHEDTLFGHLLATDGITIKPINNPVLHAELENSKDFIDKQEQAIENLIFLRSKFPDLHTKLSSSVDRLKRWNLAGLLRLLGQAFGPHAKKELLKGSTTLRLLDFYKLWYYLRKESKTNEKRPHR